MYCWRVDMTKELLETVQQANLQEVFRFRMDVGRIPHQFYLHVSCQQKNSNLCMVRVLICRTIP